MSFFLGPKSRQKSSEVIQNTAKPPSRANSIQISDRQFITPDINLINSVANSQNNGFIAPVTPPASSTPSSTSIQSSTTSNSHIYNLNNNINPSVIPSIASALPASTVSSFFGYSRNEQFDNATTGTQTSVQSSNYNYRNQPMSSEFHFNHPSISPANRNQLQYIYSIENQSYSKLNLAFNSTQSQATEIYTQNSSFISPQTAQIPVETALFEDIEYNPQYDVYWDALETLEEDYTKIDCPESVTELSSDYPDQQPPQNLYINSNQPYIYDQNATSNTSNYSLPFEDNPPPSASRKHRREEIDLWEAPDGTEHVYPNSKDADEDNDEGIKAMRYGSLGRIIASSVAASSIDDRRTSISERTPEQQIEYRKEFVGKFMKFLSQSNMNGLAKLIREKFHEAALLITPEVFEPINGRADIMIMFALLLESYPDCVWTTISTTVTPPDTITCVYLFKGTKLFSYPLASLYRQIKAHVAKLALYPINGERELSGTRLVNEVVDYIHITPPSTSSLSNHHPLPLQPPLSLPGDNGKGRISIGGLSQGNNSSRSNSLSSSAAEGEWGESIAIPRRDQSLREVRNIETAVLKEGSTSYRRKVDFVFDELDRVVRVVVINVVS